MPRPDPNHDSPISGLVIVRDELFKLCDLVEEHFIHVGASINEAMRSSAWLPTAMKPRPRPPPPRYSSVAAAAAPVGYFQACKIWVSEHRALTAAAVAFVGTGVCVLWWRRRRPYVKRRARRGKNNTKTEVVVLVGSVGLRLTCLLAQDLERRGFLVYIPISDVQDERLVQAMSRADIRSLNLDPTSPSSINSLEKFNDYLSHPNPPYIQKLRLASLVVLPTYPPPIASIADLHPKRWSDTITCRLLAPFSTIHAFGHLISVHKPSILFLTPSILPSLNPPFHALQNVTAGAMQSYISTLRKEVKHLGINIVQFKLGTFYDVRETVDKALVVRADCNRSPGASEKRLEDGPLVPAEYPSQTSLRELHNSVFDAIVRGKGRGGTVFVGRGSRIYDWVSRWVPEGLIGHILEFRKGRSGSEEYTNGYGSLVYG